MSGLLQHPGHEGTTCYLLFHSRAPDVHKTEHYAEEIRTAAKVPITMLDTATHEGEHLRALYAIQQTHLPAVLIVSHGNLAHHWHSPYLPAAREIAHYLH